jgi:hypothetical protein
MKTKESNLELEIQKLNKELESVKEEDSDAIKSLKSELEAKVSELASTKHKLATKEAEMDKGIFSGFTGATYYGQGIGVQGIGTQFMGYPSVAANKCSKCGKYFFNTSGEPQLECPDCRKAK